jgi:hypothetical protein
MTPAEVDRLLSVSVVYLRPGLAFERRLRLPTPVTIGAAIAASGVLAQAAELASCAALQVGVFGQRRTTADLLDDGDRVEIYRPLSIDPKEARRIRVAVLRRRRVGRGSAAR